MTVFEWQAGVIERSAGLLAHWVKTTDPEWLNKCPKADASSDTRSVMDMVTECVRVNRLAEAKLNGQEPPAGDPTFVDVDDACSQLLASAKAYAAAVAKQDESVLTKMFDLPFGTFPGSFVVTMPALNMSYHGGQVNYVQRLYGDTEFHFPG